MNYLNEHDPVAAAWLRELRDAGLIPPCDIDTRSIEDVEPRELAGYTQCHFFAGIGGWPLALQLARWPADRPIWTGSCPCQPFSAAGKGDGFADERHLWPSFHWLIEQCRPPIVVGEQVASSAVGPWIDLVLTDLEALGYASGAYAGPAAGVGAPHIRDRSYWVGLAASERRQGVGSESKHGVPLQAVQGGVLRLADADRSIGGQGCADLRGWADRSDAQPRTGLGGVSDGLANADGRHAGAEREQRSREQRQQQEDGSRSIWMGDATDEPRERIARSVLGTEASEHAARFAVDGRVLVGSEHAGQSLGERAGPTNGHWRDADWLGCRDGKWRPVEPGTFPLATGVPARVGRLRGYGNAIVPQQAAQFIEALKEYQVCLSSPN